MRAGQASPGLLGGRRPGRAGAAQWLEDAALVEQLFVMDGALRVRDVLRQASDAAGAPLEVTGFLRLQARARPGPRAAGAAERVCAARWPVCGVSPGASPTWARVRICSFGVLEHSLRLSVSRLCLRDDAADKSVCEPGPCWPRPALLELRRGAAPARQASAAALTHQDPVT